MRKSLIFVLCAALSLSAVGASYGGSPELAGAKEAAAAVNAFGFDMYRQLAKGSGGNLFFSPYSVSSAFAMLYGGAAGEAKSEIGAVMYFKDDIHAGMRSLKDELTRNTGASELPQLAVANAVWPDAALNVEKSYLDLAKKHYDTEVAQLNYRGSPHEAERTINDWTAKNTKGMIKKIIPEGYFSSIRAVLTLTNAIFFSSPWQIEFEERRSEEVFYAEKEEIPMFFMDATENLQYCENSDMQVVRLPYKSQDKSMVILLPQEGKRLKDVEKHLSAAGLAALQSRLKDALVYVKMPEFSVENQFSLSKQLKTLGMESIFVPDFENFPGIAKDERMALAEAFHSTYIQVDRGGTKAAAATALIGWSLGGALRFDEKIVQPIPFIADRPFVFLICDHRTGAILFMGNFKGR